MLATNWLPRACVRDSWKSSGHKTEAIFERYNIKTTDDLTEALIEVGQFKAVTVSTIAEKYASR
jgi:hypothetical protein